jgi:hypothetical protein
MLTFNCLFFTKKIKKKSIKILNRADKYLMNKAIEQLLGEKGVFLHDIVQSVLAKKNQFVTHLTVRIENLVTVCKNIYKLQIFWHYFCYTNTCYQNAKKKSLKKHGNFPSIAL